MLLCLNLAGTLVASDLRSCEEETKEDEEKKRKEGQEKRKEEEQEKEAAELVVGDRIPPTAVREELESFLLLQYLSGTKEVQTRREGPTRRGPKERN